MRLTVRDSGGDWWAIERAEHNGRSWLALTGRGSMALRCSSRFSDADVEGTATEMHAIALAIETRFSFSAKRCAVAVDGDRVSFRSPRNSIRPGVVTLAEADELAALIRRTVPRPEAVQVADDD